ncbi:MAG: class II D-tagatose-bisphosphate aldolase, non-catalytic subunit [Thermoflexus sp.]|jgi:D-tagatose-1,6-bisphosphate aldolase subunit GatZ/KbaZ|nr:class II D-tagatose-bisphosphate aldolase, non-catalytic subunit [Thermoflexus sp.]MDT7885203.1 class II D-tagatose-bisphosphate aldolase, non-catalytic subunit [Thermoflexus sp.]MDT7949135.1 class II D-tagatose-bisphosphate aldolase, non-catalytic subunit [Thermoflexus sp.]
MDYLDFIVAAQKFGEPRGIASVCSAHPLVLEATLRHGQKHGRPVLIEATANQVNQFGGYTGMTPEDFARRVAELAERMGFPRERLILGGDHLGPLPWAREPVEEAMRKAADLVRAFVRAGFTKIHLDCSMPLGEETTAPLETIAWRTAQLVRVAEEAAKERRSALRYVIGSEVPPAGGARAEEGPPPITRPEDAAETITAMRQAFLAMGLEAAWERVIALVIQPGVGFGDEVVYEYNRSAAASLARFIETVPGMIYEAHSTDYQPPEALRAMVEDHFAILKVGPALTFALREAVFALEDIEAALGLEPPSGIREAFEAAMLSNPAHWQKYYRGDPRSQKLARQYSLSDRIRYYWTAPGVQEAFQRLMRNLGDRPIPLGLLSQYLPEEHRKVCRGELRNHPHDLLLGKVIRVLEAYQWATENATGKPVDLP